MLAQPKSAPIVKIMRSPQMTDPETTAYTVQQVAERLQATEAEIRKLLRTGQLKGFKMGQRWRISRAELVKFMGGDAS